MNIFTYNIIYCLVILNLHELLIIHNIYYRKLIIYNYLHSKSARILHLDMVRLVYRV